MAVLCTAFINDLSIDPSGMYFRGRMYYKDDAVEVIIGPFPIGTPLGVQKRADYVAECKVIANSRWGLVFGIPDTIQLFYCNESLI